MTAKAAWEVRAGIVPGKPEADVRNLGRRWVYTSADHEADVALIKKEEAEGLDPVRPGAPKTLFQTRKDEAVAYWDELNDPRTNNWAELTFIWF